MTESPAVVGGVAYACTECLIQLGTDPALAAALAVLAGVWAPKAAAALMEWWKRRKDRNNSNA